VRKLALLVPLVVCALLGALSLSAQSGAEQEIRKAMQDANTAARQKDAAAWGRFMADDLVWVTMEGQLQTKKDQLAALAQAQPPMLGPATIHVYGSAAVSVAEVTNAAGAKFRQVRTWVKRDSRWQFVSHSQMPIK
jgi:ketosteroid isomerase-like protein